MPTGYTCYIEDGDIKTGKDFLMLCTRAFGIALDVRDEPLSVPTPTKFYPSQYSTERLNRAKKNVEYWENITLDEAREIYIQRHREKVESSKRILQRYLDINEKYDKVRREVESWNPPTEEHEGIKKFALEQIDMCINTPEMISRLRKDIDSTISTDDDTIKEFIGDNKRFAAEEYQRALKACEEDVQQAHSKTEFMKRFIDSVNELPGE